MVYERFWSNVMIEGGMSGLQFVVLIELPPLSLYEPRVDNLSWESVGSCNIVGAIPGLATLNETPKLLILS